VKQNGEKAAAVSVSDNCNISKNEAHSETATHGIYVQWCPEEVVTFFASSISG
jgi:hypothetical protein